MQSVLVMYSQCKEVVVVWTNDMFRMQSHKINQPITVRCKICNIGVGVVVGEVVGVVGTASV